MRRKTKIILLIGLFLIFTGTIIFISAMSLLNWDFSKLSTVTYETNSYVINEEFSNVSINTNTADVTFVLSEKNETKIECFEEQNSKHSVRVENGFLKIDVDNHKKWYEYIEINFSNPKITISLSESDYDTLFIKSHTGDVYIPEKLKFDSVDIMGNTGDVKCLSESINNVKIECTTGKITLENLYCESADLSVSTGDIFAKSINTKGNINVKISTGDLYFKDINSNSVYINGGTSDINLQNVVSTNVLSIITSTGDVEFERCDGQDVVITTSTGDVEGSFLSNKVFITKTSTGDVDVPSSAEGGKCEITTSTGDIEIDIKK